MEVAVRAELAEEFLSLARLAGFGDGKRDPSRFVRNPGLPGEEEFVLLSFYHIHNTYAFKRFCRQWEVRGSS